MVSAVLHEVLRAGLALGAAGVWGLVVLLAGA
jgi:hypothetical protein